MTCEDMAQQLGTDAYAPERECPRWATCGTCGDCVLTEPFEWVENEPLKATLLRTCGLCVEDQYTPTVVMLDTTQDAMPCGGDGWWAR